jgi:hypothetical protein
VQGARPHRYRCKGAGVVKVLRRRRPPPRAPLLLHFLLLLLCWCGAGGRGKAGAVRVLGWLGLLYAALGFGEWLRPGVLDIRARMRGGIAAVRCGSVADTGGAAVLLLCRGAGTSGAWCRPVTRTSMGRGGREKRKGGTAVRRLYRRAERGRASGAGAERPACQLPRAEGEGTLREGRPAGLGRSLRAALRGTSGAWCRPVTRTSKGRGGREKRKGGTAVRRLYRRAERGRASGAGAERSGMRRSAAGERRKGKADKRAPLVSCPGRKVKGRCGKAGRLG